MSIAAKGKKIFSFVFLTSTINRRNTTSIGLVILFMIVYALSGGKIFMAPKVRTGEGFGSVQPLPGDKPVRFSGDVVSEFEATEAVANPAKRKDKALFGDFNEQTQDTGNAPVKAHAGRPASGGSDSLSELQQRLDKLNVEKRDRRQK